LAPVRGFTLVEILVALAIVAIASGAAWLAWRGGGDAALRREASRFAGAIEYAAQRAQWRHEDLGVSADAGGWRFWRRDRERNAWLLIADDDVLARGAADGVRPRRRTRDARSWPTPSSCSAPADATIRRRSCSTPTADACADTDPLNRASSRQSSHESGRASGFTLVEILSRSRSSRSRSPRACALAQSADGAARSRRGRSRCGSRRTGSRTRSSRATASRGTAIGDALAGRHGFVWRESVGATPNPAFRRVDVEVAEAAAPDYVLARLTGYVARAPRP
jgi:type II secretion system protein H